MHESHHLKIMTPRMMLLLLNAMVLFNAIQMINSRDQETAMKTNGCANTTKEGAW
jgi:hypothetical protein